MSVRLRPIAEITSLLHYERMRFLLLPMLLALSGCGVTGPFPRTPDDRVTDEIEAKLLKVPCIGAMSHWERHYSFKSRPSTLAALLTFGLSERWFDYSKVEISYRQAGFEEFRPRRVLHHGSEPIGIDDREYDVVFGHYDILTRAAHIWACGPNMSDHVPVDQNIVVR